MCILKRGHSFQLYHNPVYEHVNNVISNDIAVFIAHLDWHLCLDIETCFLQPMGKTIFIDFLKIARPKINMQFVRDLPYRVTLHF